MPHPALRLAAPVALALCLAACGSGSDKPAPQPDESTAAPAAMTPVPDAPSSTPVADAGVPADATPLACSAEIGAARAAKLVRSCIEVSPATHPPCNAANSCAMIESEVARSCAMMGADATKQPECSSDPRGAQAAVDTIRRYYAAINAHDFGTAWQTWGDSGNPQQTFDEFRKGYAQTERTSVTTGKPGPVEGAAGSIYVEIPVTVDAQLSNGRKQHFTGSYTLRQVNIETSQGWHLTSAKLKPS